MAAVFIENDCDLDVCWSVFKPYILSIMMNRRSDGRTFKGKNGQNIVTLIDYLEEACDKLYQGISQDINTDSKLNKLKRM